MRTVSLVSAKGAEIRKEPLDAPGILSVRFDIDGDHAIEIWFDDHSKALKVSSPTGVLKVRPRSDNVIIVETLRYDEL